MMADIGESEGKETRAGRRHEAPAPAGSDPPSIGRRARNVLKPIVAGLIIDAVDFATLGPLGVFVGGFVGFAAGFWICSIYKLVWYYRLLGAMITAIYCAFPVTTFIPAATIVGAYVEFLHSGRGGNGEAERRGNGEAERRGNGQAERRGNGERESVAGSIGEGA